jgi:hypothetical protein
MLPAPKWTAFLLVLLDAILDEMCMTKVKEGRRDYILGGQKDSKWG